MTYYVYIILCDDGSFYTGYTKDVNNRVKLHVNGQGARYTKMHKPKRISYVESYEQRTEAMKREKAIKKLNHNQKQELVNSQKSKKVTIKQITKLIQAEKNDKAEKKLSWTEKLNNNAGLPKIELISEKMSRRWGKGTIIIPAPLEVDELMKKVPKGKITTINEIRDALAKRHNATIACPLTTGIFSWIAAHAAEEQRQNGNKNITPYWRTLKTGGFLNEKYPDGSQNQKDLLEREGHTIVSKGKKLFLVNYEKVLVKL